jgi:hypothetical protein
MSRFSFVVGVLLSTAPLAMSQSKQAAATFLSSSSEGPVNFLVRMERSQAELIPHGTTGGLCAIIWPNGQLHAERRTQILPSTQAAIQVYDIVLNAQGMAILAELLESEKVKEVPPFATPHLPLQVAAYYVFTADIRRAEGLQHVGFLQFGQNGGNGANPLVVVDARPSDGESRRVLLPLLEWMQATVDRVDPNPQGEVNFCEFPQN